MNRILPIAILTAALIPLHTSAAQSPNSAQEAMTELTASGDQWVRAVPDRVVVDMTIEETSTLAAEAEKGLAKKTARLESVLREKIGPAAKLFSRGTEIAAASGSDVVITNQTAMRAVRYLAAESSRLEDAPLIIDTVLQNGATSVLDVNYTVRDREELIAKGAADAAKKAAHQAELTARALGVTLGPLVAAAVAADDEAALVTREKQEGVPPADFRDQEIKVTVNVRYEISGFSPSASTRPQRPAEPATVP